MSDHRASTAQSVPPFGNLPQSSSKQFPQRSADWFSKAESLRVDREKRAHAGSFAGVISSDDIAMSFREIADQTGMTRQTVQYVFNRAMKKLAKMRNEKVMRDLRDLAHLREHMARQRELVMDDPE